MKNFRFLAFILFFSCTGNHYHDGLYVKGLGANNMSNEVLKVIGNEMTDAKYSYGGKLQGETKVTCTQFADRIEFTENGIIKIMRMTDSGSLKLSDEAIFVKYGQSDDSFTIKEIKSEPLIKQVGDKFILLGKKSNERLSQKNEYSGNTDSKTKALDIKTTSLPFVGQKWYEFKPLFSGTGTMQNYIKISPNGNVFFGEFQQNQANKSDEYESEKLYGKFSELINYKKKYYKITRDTIYLVDRFGNTVTQPDCCKNLEDYDQNKKCPCVATF